MATTISPQIVAVNATVTTAPQPSKLQQSGALISVGGTTLTGNSYQYYGSLAALQAVLSTAGNYQEVSNMATTYFAQGSANGVWVLELGTQTSAVAGISALQTWINANPGVFYSYLVPVIWDTQDEEVGSVTITNGGSGYTVAPTVTFAAPGGGGTTATGTAVISGGAVTSVTITNAGSGYTATPTVTFSAPTSGTTATGTASLISALNVMAGNYSSATGKTYFFVTSTQANLANYTNKAIFAVVPSPTAASTEFQAAAFFYQWLANSPSSATPAPPMAFRYVYGVTPWAWTGPNQTTIGNILTAFGNVIATGAEGGISTSTIRNGTTMDGQQAMFWYAVDWVLINSKQQLSATIINGSNSNPPLYYNQKGINILLAVLQSLGTTGIADGLLLRADFSATPFNTYVSQNQSNYAAGIYNGFTATITPQGGFLSITFSINAVQFLTGTAV